MRKIHVSIITNHLRTCKYKTHLPLEYRSRSHCDKWNIVSVVGGGWLSEEPSSCGECELMLIGQSFKFYTFRAAWKKLNTGIESITSSYFARAWSLQWLNFLFSCSLSSTAPESNKKNWVQRPITTMKEELILLTELRLTKISTRTTSYQSRQK